ncbi:MAG: zinc-ribbon domain-containing protein [Clostridia bacterium]|nr:zinc-ribbon domain-containing protein [Clostridia bacterium]
MFCHSCGTENPSNSKYCINCSHKLVPAHAQSETTHFYTFSHEVSNETKSKETATQEALTALGKSPLLITAAAIFAASVLFNMIGIITGASVLSQLSDLLGGVFSGFGELMAITSFFSAIPQILIVVGLIITVSSCINYTISSTGLKIIKVIMYINFVILIISAIATLLPMLGAMCDSSCLDEDFHSITDSIFLVIVLVGVYYSLSISYYKELIDILNNMISSIDTCMPYPEITIYVIIVNFFLAGSSFLTAFISIGTLGFSGMLTQLLTCASYVLFTIVMMMYSKEMTSVNTNYARKSIIKNDMPKNNQPQFNYQPVPMSNQQLPQNQYYYQVPPQGYYFVPPYQAMPIPVIQPQPFDNPDESEDTMPLIMPEPEPGETRDSSHNEEDDKGPFVFCAKCGNRYKSTLNFCSYCGQENLTNKK